MSNTLFAGIRHVVLCVVCTALVSCAHGGKPKTLGLQNITAISVAPDVVMPDAPSYRSSGQLWGGAVGGLVGAAIAYSATPEVAIKSKLDENHIDIGAILVDEMRKSLSNQGRFKVVDSDADADAVANFEVKDYGFDVAGPFTNKMKVVIRAVMTVTAKDGTRLYKRKGSGRNTAATQYTTAEFLATPSNMDAAFHEAAAWIASSQTKAMLGRPVPTEPEATPAEGQPTEAQPTMPVQPAAAAGAQQP